jgi:hypothetical protein
VRRHDSVGGFGEYQVEDSEAHSVATYNQMTDEKTRNGYPELFLLFARDDSP